MCIGYVLAYIVHIMQALALFRIT